MYSLLYPNDSDHPSAVGHLLGLLAQHPPAGQPGQPLPPPVAPMTILRPGPQVSVTPSALPPSLLRLPAPRSLLELGAMTPGAGADMPDNQNLLGKVHDWLQDRLVGERAPDAYNGLLSPNEIRNARPGLLGTIAGETWTRNLDHDVAVQREADARGEEKRILQSRQQMAQLFTQPQNETDEQRDSRYNGMFAHAVANGDLQMAKALEPFVRTLDKPMPDHTYAPKEFKLPDGSVQWVTPGGPIPIGAVPYHVPPRPANGGRTVGVAPAPIRTVGTQVKEAIDQLRHATSIKPPGLLATDEERAAYDRLQQSSPAMKQRVDSLRTVRDNMAGEQQGHAPTLGPVKTEPSPMAENKETVRTQDEYDHLTKELHWSDAKIASTYHISPLIKRAR